MEVTALSTTDPVEEVKEAIEEAVEQIEDKVDEAEATEEKKWDALVERIAQRSAEIGYEKTKKLITDLLDATEDAAEIALESMEAPTTETEATAETTEATEEQEEDVRPKRTHILFKKPMKKDE